jgi:MaoC like domain
MSTSTAVAIPDYSMATASRFIGHELGVSGWIRVDQEGIDQAACAGDRQWTHVGVERARRESPFGGPIAHGYLTLVLVAALVMGAGRDPARCGGRTQLRAGQGPVHCPGEGWRHIKVTDLHTAVDYAQTLKDLVDIHFPRANTIVLVEIAAWEHDRNAFHTKSDWHFKRCPH